MSVVFKARYTGKCAGCGEGIAVGQDVQYVDEQLVHEGCEPSTPVERAPRPVCPECFMEIALSGACSC